MRSGKVVRHEQSLSKLIIVWLFFFFLLWLNKKTCLIRAYLCSSEEGKTKCIYTGFLRNMF